MRQITLFMLATFLLMGIHVNHAFAQDDGIVFTRDKEQYRRSSLCLILLTHRNKKYAAEMQRVFENFPLPARYNEHNITGLRVISVSGKQSKSDIDKIIYENCIAQKIVGRWFNRSYTGGMDMNLIHERGGYGASHADYLRASENIRGAAMLRDEGIELLQNTFVLVCDMDYVDKKKGAAWGSVGMALLSVGMQGMAQANYNQARTLAAQGDYSAAKNKMRSANAWNAGSLVSATGSAVVADIGGFRVKMNAYLYKLRWNDEMTHKMYNEYWVDKETPKDELESRKKGFEEASSYFRVDFIGKYKTSSSKTILRSWNNEDEVILDVCERCVNKGLKELAEKFVVFRPRAPFYMEGNTMYSHIGRKEEVSYGRKYEIIQPYKDKRGQICYKRVGKAQAGNVWNNREVRFDQYFNPEQKGTVFFCNKASVDLSTPGLQLREL